MSPSWPPRGIEAAARRLKASYAADQPNFSNGIMACVRPNEPGRFIIEGGTPADDLHVTLAYFGSIEDDEWTESAREQIAEVMSAEVAREFDPINGEITAVTTFDLAGEEEPPLVLLIDAPGLGRMRDALVRRVDASLGEGQEIKKNHDFMAHMTLAYGATDEEMAFAKSLVGEKVRFDAVELVWGDESSVWPFEGSSGSPIPDSGDENGLRFGDTFTEFGPEEGDSMPYEIVEDHPDCDGYGVVKSEDDELMGCHESEDAALKQIAALDAAEAEDQADDEAEAAVDADPLAIVIADELTTEERLSAVEEFLAAQKGGSGGGGADDEDGLDEGPPDGVIEDADNEGGEEFGAIAPHDTPTTDAPWDGPAAEKNVRSGEGRSYFDNIYAYYDDGKDESVKASYRFIHHEVDAEGAPGAANLRACSTGIGVLNGGRGGTTIPADAREGVYRHLASHLRDADKEAPELMGADPEELADALEEMANEAASSFKALPSHSSPTVNPPTFEGWDGNEVKKRTRSGETESYYGKIYAWRDSQADPTNKTAYKFPHHNVSPDGTPGAAVMWAVHSAIAVIDDSTIPTGDYQGVYNHLAKHLRDGGIEDIPELGEDNASVEEVRAAIASVRTKYLSMVEEAAMSAADISGADDTALVGEVVRRWFESVAANKGVEAAEAEAEAEVEFAADEAATDCPCHKGVLEDGATHAEGCPFAHHDEDEMAEGDGEDAPEVDAPEDEEDVVGDFASNDYEWEGVLIVEGLPSGDGRMIDEEALTWRDLPVPLMLQTINAAGHDGAVIAGSIHEIERKGHEIIGRGNFDSGKDGQEAKRLLTEGTMRGVSADIDSVSAELRGPDGADVAMEDIIFGDPPEGVMEVLTGGRIMGATMTPFPAFQEAQLHVIGTEAQAEDLVLVASGSTANGEVWRFTSPYPLVARGQEPVAIDHSLVASAASATVTELPVIPVHPPLAWFAAEDEELDPNMAFKVFPNGRIYGLVARWGTCHIGFADRCVPVPRPHDGYATFRGGHVLTAEGTLVSTGPIYADTVHPSLKMSASDAQAFYAHTGCALGDVVLYEGEFGILAAGAVKSDAPIEAVNRLRAAGVSPDWRTIDRNLEIVGLLSVNVSGFPVKALAASAGEGDEDIFKDSINPVEGGTPRYAWSGKDEQFNSLVAAGSLVPCATCGQSSVSDQTALAILDLLNKQQAQIDELTTVIRPYRMEQMAAKMAELGFGVASDSIKES
jgi:2'-5' RNA ligase